MTQPSIRYVHCAEASALTAATGPSAATPRPPMSALFVILPTQGTGAECIFILHPCSQSPKNRSAEWTQAYGALNSCEVFSESESGDPILLLQSSGPRKSWEQPPHGSPPEERAPLCRPPSGEAPQRLQEHDRPQGRAWPPEGLRLPPGGPLSASPAPPRRLPRSGRSRLPRAALPLGFVRAPVFVPVCSLSSRGQSVAFHVQHRCAI